MSENSVIPYQIDAFNKIFNKSTDDEGMKTLYALNCVRVPSLLKNLIKHKFITNEAAQTELPLKGLSILEVGCGAGIFCEPLVVLGANVTGLDAAQEPIEYAIKRSKEKNIEENLKYICDTIENFCQFNKEKYDVVIASEVLEHVNNPDEFNKCYVKTLKPNGGVFITTINRTIKSMLIAKIFCEYIIRIIPRGIHEWNKFLTTEETTKIFENSNCRVVDTNGYYFSYFYDKFFDTTDTSVFYYMFAIKNE